MRPRRKKSSKPWHFDDYDESEYTLDNSSDSGAASGSGSGCRDLVPARANVRLNNTNLSALCPKNAGLQIRISGDISICVVGNNGRRRELFRFVSLCTLCNVHVSERKLHFLLCLAKLFCLNEFCVWLFLVFIYFLIFKLSSPQTVKITYIDILNNGQYN